MIITIPELTRHHCFPRFRYWLARDNEPPSSLTLRRSFADEYRRDPQRRARQIAALKRGSRRAQAAKRWEARRG